MDGCIEPKPNMSCVGIVYVHRGDGTIGDRDTYGADPLPPVAKP